MKRTLLLLFALLLITGGLWAQERAVRTFTVGPQPPAPCGTPGIGVPVIIDVADNLIAFQFKLYYDPTIMTFSGVLPTGPFGAWAFAPSVPAVDGFGSFIPVAAAGPAVGASVNETLCVIFFDTLLSVCDGSVSGLDFFDPVAQLYSTNAGETDVTPTAVPGILPILCPANPPIGAVANTAPANGATGVANTAQLDWVATANANTYDVYFGTATPPPFVGTVAVNTYDPGALLDGQIYYWYVVASNTGNDCAAATGAEWSFTTAAAGLPDLDYDSESLASDSCATGGVGDANSVVDPGESIAFNVLVINNGAANATTVTGTLSTITAGVTVTQNFSTYSDIPSGGGVVTSDVSFTYDVADTVACGTMIDFSLDVAADGPYTNTVTFQVQVGASSGTLLTEGFEAWPPAGWGNYMTGAADDPGIIQGMLGTVGSHNDAHSGTYYAWHDDFNNASADSISWLSTPQITIPAAATTAQMTFWQRDYYQTFYQYHGVWITTDASQDPSVSTYVEIWTADSADPWEQITVDLSAYIGQSVYLAFRYEGDYMDEWYLDDVEISSDAAGVICNICAPACVPPGAFTLTTPTDGATNQPIALTLDWADSAGAVTYDLYLGTASPPPLYSAGLGISEAAVAGLTNSTQYYWYVTATNACPPDAVSPEWYFNTQAACVPPGAFALTTPADAAIDQPIALTLDWADSAGAVTYDLYFGTVSPPPLYSAGLAVSQEAVAGLTYATQYYWYVIATNACLPDAVSAEWSFTTIAAPVVPTVLTAMDTPGNCNTTVTIPISLDEMDGMLAFQFDLYFDPTYITGVSAAPAGAASGFLLVSNVYANYISVAGSSGVALGPGTGTIATVDLLIDISTPDTTVTFLDLQNSQVNALPMIEVDGNLTVTCQPPILAYNSSVFTDQCIYGGIGHNDGVADPGESLYIDVTLINNGLMAATGVSAVMTTPTAGATVMMANSTYPDIPASGGTAISNNQYLVMLDDTFPCGTPVVLDLAIASNEGAWVDQFQITTGVKTSSRVIIFQEAFETWPPAGWQNINNGGCGTWESTAVTGGYLSGGNSTGGTGEAADANSDYCGSAMDTELITPSIDLTTATSAFLEYNCRLEFCSGCGDDTGYTDISIDGGTTWTNLRTENADDGVGHLVNIDLTPYVGNSILIRFHYVVTAWGWGWMVDDVTVDATSGGGGVCNPCVGVPCYEVEQFTNVSPEDGSTVDPPVTLVWEASANADYYDIYVGTDPMNSALVGSTPDTTYTLTDLAEGTIYYWLVQAVNDCSFRNGPRWTFTTSGAGGEPGGPTDVFVAAAASTTGARGTNWQTDIRILNPVDHMVSYMITYIETGTNGVDSPFTYTGTIPPGEEMMMDDMLTNMFGMTTSSGAIHVTSDDPIYVTTRTYTTSDQGTYGQFIPALDSSYALTAPTVKRSGSTLRQTGVGHLVMVSGNDDWRTNIGFVEVTGVATSVMVTLYDADNNEIGSSTYQLLPLGHHQVNIFQDLGITDPYDIARAEVAVTGPGAVLAYASVIDEGTGDAIYTPAQIYHPENMQELVIATAATAEGVNGTNWQTELRVFNPADVEQSVIVTYYSGTTAVVFAAVETIAPKAIFTTDNALDYFFNILGDTSGSLTLSSNVGVVAMSRIYTTTDIGSYGQSVLPRVMVDAIEMDTMGYMIHLTQNDEFRSNIGFTEAGFGEVTIGIDVYDDKGVYLGTTGFGMGVHGHKQLNEVVKEMGLAPLDDGYIKFRIVDGQGRVFPYLSVIDYASGDAIYVSLF